MEGLEMGFEVGFVEGGGGGGVRAVGALAVDAGFGDIMGRGQGAHR